MQLSLSFFIMLIYLSISGNHCTSRDIRRDVKVQPLHVGVYAVERR